MKLSNRLRTKIRIELSMTSMIDVVFLLLIFFLVATTFMRPTQQLAAVINVNEQNADQTKTDLEPAIVDIILQGNVTLYRIGAITTNDLEQIKTTLSTFEIKEEGAFVRVADNVPFEKAAQVIGACRSSGFKTVSYLPLKPR